ncbi:hypothetical protein [Nonomuraea endophytica]|uniref:hypothetical protein n=1 Tax=Nonomuraea endophytica TaxID=714136 RepID=UPI0037C5460F
MDILTSAATYIQLNARLLDRFRFEALFGDGDRRRVLDVLRAYQNHDGGFGNALEPDLRGPGSQPEPVEVAFHILDELDAFDDSMVNGACAYLGGVCTPDGGVPFVLPSVRDTPRAPWWQTDDDPPGNLVPTASIAGLLHKHGVRHPWLVRATDFCWSAIAAIKDETTPYEARAVVLFLELAPDRERAEAEFGRLKEAILATVALDPDAPGDAHFPLDFAPEPMRLPLFAPDVIECHLDALVAQQKDGGWGFNWTSWTPAVQTEWGGHITVERLKTLRAYGRI